MTTMFLVWLVVLVVFVVFVVGAFYAGVRVGHNNADKFLRALELNMRTKPGSPAAIIELPGIQASIREFSRARGLRTL